MSALLLEQLLNGLQFGGMLFLLAAGLTLIFGIMGIINLAHGSFYMIGAYVASSAVQWTGSFLAGGAIAVVVTGLLGAGIERVVMRRLYAQSHLAQVLATFGLVLFFNALVIVVWGTDPRYLPTPEGLKDPIRMTNELIYPAYRFAITAVSLITAVALYVFINRTRVGMLIRAGSTHREMVEALGININLVYMLVFGGGAALAALAGVMTGPIMSVQAGMGEPILILALVLIVIGGIGSIRGAFVAALLVGCLDAFSRHLLPKWFGYSAGPAVASMSIYIFMALILFYRPQGLFSARRT